MFYLGLLLLSACQRRHDPLQVTCEQGPSPSTDSGQLVNDSPVDSDSGLTVVPASQIVWHGDAVFDCNDVDARDGMVMNWLDAVETFTLTSVTEAGTIESYPGAHCTEMVDSTLYYTCSCPFNLLLQVKLRTAE